MDDLISRQAAIDAADKIIERDTSGNNDVVKAMTAWKMYVESLPSAQPQTCDDAISREDAKWVVFCNRDHVEDQANAIDSLPCVQPSAQPEIIRCRDCKHWICHDRRCRYWNHGVKPLDWCCHAERREDG